MATMNSSVEREKVLRVTEDEAAAVETGDIERYLSLLSRDAVFMPQNATAKTGDELREWLREFLARVTIHYTRFEHGETIVREDLACHAYTCSWTATPKAGGAPIPASFKGLHVLRREPDGSWRISLSVWNTDPEPNNQ